MVDPETNSTADTLSLADRVGPPLTLPVAADERLQARASTYGFALFLGLLTLLAASILIPISLGKVPELRSGNLRDLIGAIDQLLENRPDATDEAAAPEDESPQLSAPPPITRTTSPDSDVILIGHVGPTTGPIAHLGKDNENGALLAIEEWNAKGVTIGGRRMRIELLAEDDGGDPRQGTSVATKLVDAKVNGVIGHLNSGTTIPASQIYSQAGIPQISPSATNPKYTRQGLKTTFRMVADDVQLARTMGRVALSAMKAKSIVVIDDRTAYGAGIADHFADAVESGGGRIVDRQFTTDSATDFTKVLTAVSGKRPDLIFYGGMDSQAGLMLQQMKAIGLNVPLVGGDGICSSELARLAKGAMADGQVICGETGGVDESGKIGMEAFSNRFKARFNADVQVYAPYVYDAVNVMISAMVAADSANPDAYRPFLARTQHQGVTGPISFDDKGDIQNGAITLYTFQNGRRVEMAVVR